MVAFVVIIFGIVFVSIFNLAFTKKKKRNNKITSKTSVSYKKIFDKHNYDDNFYYTE